jgi:hypothetical protein
VGLEAGEVLVRDRVGLAVRHEHVLAAALDALVGALVVAVLLGSVLGRLVLAGALRVADGPVPGLFRREGGSRGEEHRGREHGELLHELFLLDGIDNKRRP